MFLKKLTLPSSLMRFALIGVVATLIHALCALALVFYLAVPVIVSHAAGFVIALSVSFFGHYYYSFRSSESLMSCMARFLLVALSAYGLNALLLLLLLEELPNHIGDLIKLLISIAVFPLISYVLGKFWVFREGTSA